MVDLSTYVRVGRYDLPEPTRTQAPSGSVLAQEVSAVTYNKDTDTLFVVGDAGTSVVQISKTGELIDSMTLATGSSPQGTEFYDPEGLTYIGNGQFVMTEERDRNVVLFTYQAGTTLTRETAKTVDMGTFSPNLGFEGISYDPLTDGYIIVKEKEPISVFQSGVDFDAGTATNGSPTTENAVDLFAPDNLGIVDIADVFALSNIDPQDDTMLILSQESARILEVDRNGNVLSVMNLYSDPNNPLPVENQQHEGITMDADGFIYVVSENGGGDADHPQLWVFAPANTANEAPTAIGLLNPLDAIEENVSTTSRVKVAGIAITDDGQGVNNFTLSGADAALFEVDNTGVYLRAGSTVDFETQSSYSFTVNVDDPGLGGSTDASVSYTLGVTDVANEGGSVSSLYISEVAPWSSGNSPVGADWFEITNPTASAIDISGWKVDDSSGLFASAVALSGVTSIAAGESVIFIEGSSQDVVTAFIETWFDGTAPAGLQIGTYSGSGIGLSTGGDALNLYDGTGELQTSISFGAADAGPVYQTFDNAAGLNGSAVTTLSLVGPNGGFVAATDSAEIGSPGTVGRIFISEVAPWSSGTGIGADWFEVTNGTAFALDITGWKMDDNSQSPNAAVALSGITTIAPGESVIFLETSTPTTTVQAFIDTWFGGSAPAGLQIGTYSGSGVGLGGSGDAVNLYDGGGTLQATVSFGASGSTLATFENATALNDTALTERSAVALESPAYAAPGDTSQIGSPGEFVAINEAPVATDDTPQPVAEGGSYVIDFSTLLANDSAGPLNDDGQTLTITTVGNAVGGSASIVGSTVVFTPTANFSGQASFDYSVRDNGTSFGLDDFKSDTGSVSFTVTANSVAPGFTSPASFSAAENQTSVGTVAATDPQNDSVSYSIVGGADQALFGIDASTGALSFLAAPDFEAPADSDLNNAYLVEVRASDGTNGSNQAITVNVTDVAERQEIYVTEVAPWSSGDSPVGADWFELTNRGTTAIDLTGWKVDDNSASFANAVALNGLTSIAPGESVIFVEGSNPTTAESAFIANWFGGTAPSNLQIGTYTGSGIGLGTGGDAVNIYDASGTLQANISFGASPTGPTFTTFNNAGYANGSAVSTLSTVDVNGAFRAPGNDDEIGSPGSVGRIFVSEVAPWSSGTSVGADWFEVTNSTAAAIDLTGWKVDDSSASFANAVSLSGITSIAAGESVIFLETSQPSTAIAAFVETWFDGVAPEGLQFGTYSGSGIGLSSNGDAVNLYDANGVLQASVSFGATSTLASLDNGAALDGGNISTLSSVGVNEAIGAANDSSQIGSPGFVTSNDAPIAASDNDAVDEDATITGNILTNDQDPQAADSIGLLTVGRTTIGAEPTIVQGQFGTLTISRDGSYSYVADADVTDTLVDGAQRTDSFTYVVADSSGASSTATLSVLVTAIADSVVVTLPPTQLSYEGSGADEVVTTGSGDNVVFGMAGADVIEAGSGADTLAGGAGNDSLVGGAGDDYLYGGAVGDSASEGGDDTLMGGDGADHIYGNSASGAGNDADGDDLIDTGDGVNVALGHAGNDSITGGAGRDRIQGGADADTIDGGIGTDSINGNQGNDLIHGGDGNDILRGGKDDDVLFGDGGNDILRGELGNDRLVAGAGVDVMTGGAGSDIFQFTETSAGNFDMPAFYTAITDFEQGIDTIMLNFAVSAGDVLQGGSQATVAAARTAAQQLLDNHAGTQDVVATQVGAATYLFYNAAGTAGDITAIIEMRSTTASAMDMTDFMVAAG
jgi:VCBS repeat-containing protein